MGCAATNKWSVLAGTRLSRACAMLRNVFSAVNRSKSMGRVILQTVNSTRTLKAGVFCRYFATSPLAARLS